MKGIRRGLVSLLVLLLVVLIFAETREIVILHTSDLHGYIYPVDYATKKSANHGLAKVASVIKEQRSKYGEENVIVIDTGDLIQGSPMAYYSARFDNNEVNPMVLVMNHLKFAASTLGNHEFNYGMDILNKVISEAEFPFLSANIVDEQDVPYFMPYAFIDVNGILVCILGLPQSTFQTGRTQGIYQV
ncbi:metallophosphoesterase [Fervidobacterium sp.]